jgi:hypothetical protein
LRFFARSLLFALLLTSPATFAQENIVWHTSQSGGSSIKIPAFLTDGPATALLEDGEDVGTSFSSDRYPAYMSQYRTNFDGSPHAYLNARLGGDEAEQVTYQMYREKIAAISGFVHGRVEIFYGMCRLEQVLVCFEVHYDAKMQTMMGPIVDRMVKSFQANR